MKCQKYCAGCGLCHSCHKTEMEILESGFQYPKELDNDFFNKYCFAGKLCHKKFGTEDVWGNYEKIFVGYSNNEFVRKTASSGGILTEICMYLLENKIVDAIIQTKMDPNNPIKTITVINKSSFDVMKCMGSRYTISTPLDNIVNILDKNLKYAFVGKPCDVQVLKNYCEENKIDNIFLYLSFFCAGEPSYNANKKLINKLGFTEKTIKELNYRGNGWPGYTVGSDGKKSNKMSYDESWGNILGRDIRYICRFCSDGIGEAADICCGDAWYIGDNKKPSFSEHDGRNVVFARTKKGLEVLEKMQKDKRIVLSDYQNNIDDLIIIQKYQYLRRTTLYPVLITLKLFRKDIPNYDLKKLKKLSKYADMPTKLRRCFGTIKRIINKKI